MQDSFTFEEAIAEVPEEGETFSFEDAVGESADFDIEEPTRAGNKSLIGDLGSAINIGATVDIPKFVTGQARQVAHSMLFGSGGQDNSATRFVDEYIFNPISSKLEARQKRISEEYTPETKAANKKKWIGDDAGFAESATDGLPSTPENLQIGYTAGDAFDDPSQALRKGLIGTAESVPGSIVTMGPTAMLSRKAGVAAMEAMALKTTDKALIEKAGSLASQRAAMIFGGGGEGLQGGGAAYEDTRNEILGTKITDELRANPNFKRALDRVESSLPENEREQRALATLADEGAGINYAISSAVDAVFGAVGDRYIGDAAMGKGTRLGSAMTGLMQETPTEYIQSYGEKVGSNLGLKATTTPDINPLQGAGEEAFGGAISGGLMGAGMGGAFHSSKTDPITPIAQAQTVDEAIEAAAAAVSSGWMNDSSVAPDLEQSEWLQQRAAALEYNRDKNGQGEVVDETPPLSEAEQLTAAKNAEMDRLVAAYQDQGSSWLHSGDVEDDLSRPDPNFTMRNPEDVYSPYSPELAAQANMKALPPMPWMHSKTTGIAGEEEAAWLQQRIASLEDAKLKNSAAMRSEKEAERNVALTENEKINQEIDRLMAIPKGWMNTEPFEDKSQPFTMRNSEDVYSPYSPELAGQLKVKALPSPARDFTMRDPSEVYAPYSPENAAQIRAQSDTKALPAPPSKGWMHKNKTSVSILDDDVEAKISLLERQMAAGEVGSRSQKEDTTTADGQTEPGEWDGVKSTNPDWLKTGILKDAGKKGIAIVIAKARRGMKLTNKQAAVWAELTKTADKEYEDDPATVAARAAAQQGRNEFSGRAAATMTKDPAESWNDYMVRRRAEKQPVVVNETPVGEQQSDLSSTGETQTTPRPALSTMATQENTGELIAPGAREDDTGRREGETFQDWLYRLAGKSGPPSKAAKLRKQADKLMKESYDMVAMIPPGQPISSTRDRNSREKAWEKARKAGDLNKQADELEKIEAEKPIAPQVKEAPTTSTPDTVKDEISTNQSADDVKSSRSALQRANLEQMGFKVNDNEWDIIDQLNEATRYALDTIPWRLPDTLVGRDRKGRVKRAGVPRSDFEVAERLSNIFRKRIVWTSFDDSSNINGLVVRNRAGLSGVVFINPKSANPAHVVLGHELSHWMEVEHPEVFADLYDAIEPLINSTDKYRATYSHLQGLSDRDVNLEIIGDLMGDAFGDPKFWGQVAEQAGGEKFREIAAKVRQWIGSVVDRLKGMFGFQSSQLVRDLNKARFAIARATAKYAEAQGKNSSTMAAGSNVMQSVREMFKPVDVDPDVRYSVASVGTGTGITGNGTGPAWETPEDSKKDSFLYNAQDKLIDMKRIQDNIEKAMGPIQEQHDVRMAEELYHKRAAKRVEDMLVSEVNPLMKELGAIFGGDMAEFEEYMHALHAPEANESLRQRNPNEEELKALKEQAKADRDNLQKSATVKLFIDKERELAAAERDVEAGDADDSLIQVINDEIESLKNETVVSKYIKAREKHRKIRNAQPYLGDNTALSGMSNEAAEALLAGLPEERMRQYKTLAAKWRQFMDKTRDILVQYELESQDTVDAWAEAFENYVPLHREDMESGMGIGQGFSVKGSATRSRTGSNRKVVDVLAHIVMQRERAIVRGEKAAISRALYGLASANPNPDVWTIETPPVVREFDPVTGLVVSRPDPMYKSRPNAVVHRFVNRLGKIEERAVLFNERSERGMRLAESLKNLDTEQLGTILRTSAVLTRWFSAVNTQYNLIFGPVNAIRDTWATLLNLTNTPLAGRQKQVAGRVATSIGPLFKAIWAEADGRQLDTDIGRAWKEMQLEGGTTGFRDMFEDADARGNDLKKAMLATATSKNIARLRWVKQQVSQYNDVMENAARLAVYMEARSQGLSKKRSASLAKNITMNFNRKGKMGMQAGAMYAFFNAAMQGTEKLYSTMRGPAGKKILVGGLLMGAAQAVLLAAAGFDDDEPPEFVRERSIIIPIGGKKYITIPMPLGFNVIPNFSRVATEWALSGGKRTGERVTSIVGSLAETFNPIGNSGFSVQTIAPTMIDPLIALSENKDWTGRPIAKPDFNTLKPTPGHARMKDTASQVGVGVSRVLNMLTGGSEYTPGLLSPTPDQIDYLIGQAFGGVGRETLKAAQVVKSGFIGEELPAYKIPLVSRFYGDSADSSSTSTAFYRNIKRMNVHAAEIEGLRENRGYVQGYISKNPDARFVKRAELIYKQVHGLQKKRRELLKNDRPKAAVKAVEKNIKSAMESLNKQIE